MEDFSKYEEIEKKIERYSEIPIIGKYLLGALKFSCDSKPLEREIHFRECSVVDELYSRVSIPLEKPGVDTSEKRR